MKKIEAVIKPFKLDEVKAALAALGVEGMTVWRSRVLAGKRATRKFTAAANTRWTFLPKIKIEVVTSAAQSDAVVDAILRRRPKRARSATEKFL